MFIFFSRTLDRNGVDAVLRGASGAGGHWCIRLGYTLRQCIGTEQLSVVCSGTLPLSLFVMGTCSRKLLRVVNVILPRITLRKCMSCNDTMQLQIRHLLCSYRSSNWKATSSEYRSKPGRNQPALMPQLQRESSRYIVHTSIDLCYVLYIVTGAVCSDVLVSLIVFEGACLLSKEQSSGG